MSFRFFFPFIFLILLQPLQAQQFWGNMGSTPNGLWSLDVLCSCPDCTEEEFIGLSVDYSQYGYSIAPNGNVYALVGFNKIYQINTATGAGTLVLAFSDDTDVFDLRGLAFATNEIFYSINRVSAVDTLYEVNLITGDRTMIGPLDHQNFLGDLTFFNGDLYYIHGWIGYGLVRIKLNPMEDELLVVVPNNVIMHALTASTQCHTLLSFDLEADQFVTINAIDGDINIIGNNVYPFMGITSLLEYVTPGCEVSIDLDCNDSSGADDYDYNSLNYYCYLEEGVPVTDYDVLLLYDTLIEQMTIELNGILPDGTNEYLELEQSYPNLIIFGSGTQTITIESDGEASSTKFKAALRGIRYHNSAFIPTPGEREVIVNVTTYYGTATNQATAFIDVVEWPSYDLDLGSDVQVCESEQLVLNTQLEDVDHIWSTNSTAQYITVSEPGTYSVTVTGDEYCPAIDSIEVILVPKVFVELGNDVVVCEGEEVTIQVEVESPFPLTININVTPGVPITLTEITSDTEISVIASELTYYVISSVTSSNEACITIGDEEQIIDIIPSYNDTVTNEICEGDSLLIGNAWIHDPGIYTEHATTFFGCDSIITHHVSFSNTISIFQETNTCIVSDTGTFFQMINNPVGCDTIIETHVQLGELDTTFIMSGTCRIGQEGVFSNVLTSVDGCDSVVVSTVLLLPPQDTSWLNQISCDSSALGIFQNIFVNNEGCDSLVITNIVLGNPDTTLVFTTSCDSSSLGVFEMVYQNQFHCDSFVFTTISYASQDSVFISGNTCNPNNSGTFVDTYTNVFGCDSIVTEVISLVPAVYFSYNSISCDEDETGVFIDTLTSISGCDSIVTVTVSLLPESETFITSSTCNPAEAGVFVENLINQFGCDSIITLTVSLIPADTTVLASKTCDPTEVGDIEITFTNQDDCDSLVIEQTTLYPLPELQIEVTSDFNGYAISCFGESDGGASVEVSGILPWTYLWSNGSNDQMITGLNAGSYAVTVTDGNGCSTSGEVVLLEPEEFSINFVVSHPDCFDHQQGSITVEQSGGIEPIRYSLDDVNYQPSPVFDQLSGGTFTVTAIDANDCEVKEIIWINVPLMVNVELPDDQASFPGDTVIVNAIVNVPFDSLVNVEWSGLNNPVCPNCLTQPVAPIITTTYSVTVTTHDGCMDEDAVTLFLESSDDVYVPNIFSPNEDGINDVLIISGGSGIKEISEFVVFDRWGDMVFYQERFQVDDPSYGWNGKRRSEELNPGVFSYRVIVQLKDGRSAIRYGDVTIVK